jgi:polysaccharide biosynthesis transport protein
MLQKNSLGSSYDPSEGAESAAVAQAAISAAGVLRRQWILILAALAICFIVVAIYLIITPPVFEAQAILIIDAKKEPSFQQQAVQSDAPVDAAVVSSQVEIIKSRSIADAVIKKLNLLNGPEFGGDRIGSPSSSVTEEEKKTSLRREMNAVRSLVDRLTVIRVGPTYIIEINYRSLDPDRAAQIANAVADAYITDQLNAKYEAARRAAVWLQDRINELHDQVATAETAVVDYQKKNNIVSTSIAGGPNSRLLGQQKITELNSQLGVLRAATAEANARLDRINEVLKSGTVNATVSDSLKSDIVSKLRSQYFDLAFREADWSSRYGKDHLAAVGLRRQMQDIRDGIFDEVKRLAESYKSDLQIAKQREDDVKKDLSKAIADNQNSDSAEITLRQLEANAQSYKKLYDNFLQRYTESVQQQSFPISEARIISPATPPTVHSSPKTFLILAATCIFGSVLSFGIGWVRDRATSVFHTTEDVESLLDLNCLALIPTSPGTPPKPSRSRKTAKSRGTADPWSSLYEELENVRKTPRTIRQDDRAIWAVSKQPLSVFTEALRALKLALDLNVLVETTNIVGFTSSLPNEGKSTIACALAQLVSLSGARCLLVDGDLRNPTLSRQLAGEAQAGLLEVLSGKFSLEEVVWKDNSTNMNFLPMVARSRLTNTSDILASRAVQGFFSKLRESYDYVIVDCSPISPVVDVRATARWVDAYVYVIEWGVTRPDVVQYALKSAPELRNKILGVVLNKVNLNFLKRHGSKYRDYLSEKYIERYVREV